MASTGADQVRPVVDPAVTAAGYDLEDVTISSAGRRSVVKIIVDRDGGVDLDDVAAISRACSEALDAANTMGESAYTLEVTSPGVDRPLTEPRHWRRNVGRMVETGKTKGRITEVTDDGVSIEVNGDVETISFEDAKPGKIVLEFNK